ncbi:MAG: hypothetical protein AAGM36_04135 [Cyanobacteria bacterium J06597_1]
MKRLTFVVLAALLLLGLAIQPGIWPRFGVKDPAAIAAESQVPLFEGLETVHHSITTDSDIAQQYFDQGLALTYGFNHAEAVRAYREAVRQDPDCAMCYWGMAFALGPNINAAMDDEAVPEAYSAMQMAEELAENASDRERAYIQALSARYSNAVVEDRSPLDTSFAEEMGKVVEQYPDDLDAAVFYAEALMDTTPWNYWDEDGQPREATSKVLDTLESVMRQEPEHPGANHLYIHAVEAVHPEWAEAAADRLGNLVPGSGHLVHMPSHIYINIGRYRDAATANVAAIAADNEYATQCHAQGIYPLAYMPHNEHFLWASAAMSGQSELSIQVARDLASGLNQEMMPELGAIQHYSAIPYYALQRFGRYDEILEEPAPASGLGYPTGVWHYVRGMAYAAKEQFDEAEQELQQLQAIAADPAIEDVTIWDLNSTARLLEIASDVLQGEIASRQEDWDGAIAHLEAAIAIEDQLIYDEPEDWNQSVRQLLGAVLLEADRPVEAEAVYREDLLDNERNGWSLFGLGQSLEAQGRDTEAMLVQARFDEAWQDADVQLTASRF